MPEQEGPGELRSLLATRALRGKTLILGDDILKLPDPEPLIETTLDLNSTAMLFGPYGIGKSFVALDWALRVSYGMSWCGKRCTPGRTLYLIGEGGVGFKPRVQAWMEHNEIGTIPNTAWQDYAVNLTEPKEVDLLKGWIRDWQPVFVVFDTVARHMPGADENTSPVMSKLIETMDWVASATGGCALAIHHPGKVSEQGPRGHSSLPGALDTIIQVQQGEHKNQIKLEITKQKNHDYGGILATLEKRLVGNSIVFEEAVTKTTKWHDAMIQSLMEASSSATYGTWLMLAKNRGVPESSFKREIERLKGSGKVDLVSEPGGPSPVGHYVLLSGPG